MKRHFVISGLTAAIPIAIMLSISTVGTAFAAYYLIGDSSNTGSSNTTFTTTYSGDAWKFTATGSSATALVGSCPNGTSCWGVQGIGTGIGVYGQASTSVGSTAMGVRGGGSISTSGGTAYGGYFTSSSGSKTYGVYASGNTAGVYATSSADAVRATSTSASGNGVHATGSGSSFYGLWGEAAGNGYGAVGASVGGTGVYGTSTGSTSNNSNPSGVYGYNGLSAIGAKSRINSGVFGQCTNCNGVFGSSANFVAVRGVVTGTGKATYGGFFTSPKGTGVYAATNGGLTALRAVQRVRGAGLFAGIFDGNVRINGNYYATGTKTAVVPTSQGERLMYSEEATQNYFSDQGIATVRNGRVVVKLDALFAQTVDLTKPYMVIVTPNSFDTAGLGVGNQTASSFEVRELNHGTGTFTFSWRVTALRKGYSNLRMAPAPSSEAADSPAAALPSTTSPNDVSVKDPSVAPPTTKSSGRSLPDPEAPASK